MIHKPSEFIFNSSQLFYRILSDKHPTLINTLVHYEKNENDGFNIHALKIHQIVKKITT